MKNFPYFAGVSREFTWRYVDKTRRRNTERETKQL
jgi:hypothetical protein